MSTQFFYKLNVCIVLVYLLSRQGSVAFMYLMLSYNYDCDNFSRRRSPTREDHHVDQVSISGTNRSSIYAQLRQDAERQLQILEKELSSKLSSTEATFRDQYYNSFALVDDVKITARFNVQFRHLFFDKFAQFIFEKLTISKLNKPL